MNTFLLVHRHPDNYRPTAETAAAWATWFEEFAASVVDLGNPVFERATVGGHERSGLPLGGYTLIAAADFDGAVALAERCGRAERGRCRSGPVARGAGAPASRPAPSEPLGH